MNSSIHEQRKWLRGKNLQFAKIKMECAGVPARYRDVTPELELVQRWIGDLLPEWLGNVRPPGVFFHGPAGAGKTLCATVYIRELLLSGIQCIWWNDVELASYLRKLVTLEKKNGEDVVAHLSSIPYLFLDDLGASRTTEFWTEARYQILNARYNQGLPTVITTNEAQSLDDRIARRVIENSVEVKMEI